MSKNFTHNKNTVSTPWHIAEFLTDYFEARNKRVFDPTAGVGSFLEYAENKYGIEFDTSCYEQLKEKYPDGHFIHGSLFEQTEWIKEQDIEVTLMNPPFNQEKQLMPAEYISEFGEKGTDATKGLWWVKFVADTVNQGYLAAIIPPGAVGSGKEKIDKIKKELLEHHTLESVLQLNNELFYPGAATSAVCLIFKLGEPHNGQTIFCDFSDDGLVKDRTLGRIDKENKWQDIKKEWLDVLRNKKSNPKKESEGITSAVVEVNGKSAWNPPSYWEIDTQPTDDDFRKTVRDYMDWQMKMVGGLNNYLLLHPELKPSKESQIRNLEKIINTAQMQIEALEPLTDEEIHRPLSKQKYDRLHEMMWNIPRQ